MSEQAPERSKKRPPERSLKITDREILQKHHRYYKNPQSIARFTDAVRFLRDQGYDEEQKPKPVPQSKQQRYGEYLAKKYYDKLFKQCAIVDLSMYESGNIGCRWRTEKEVLASKGQSICANKVCSLKSRETYEINFRYLENQIKKNALVKVRLCAECAKKLNHKKQHPKLQHPDYEEEEQEFKKQKDLVAKKQEVVKEQAGLQPGHST